MKKNKIIISIILIIILIIALLALYLYKSKKSNNQIDSTRIYDENGQVIADFSKKDEVVETEENIS